MNPRSDRANRVLLTLIGLLLLAIGVAGVLLGYGVFGQQRATRPVIDEHTRSFVHRNSGWFWPVVAVVAAILALLALRWLLAQVRTDRIGRLEIDRDRETGGRTTLYSAAVTDAVAEEVESYRGVRRASARLIGDSREPDLVLAVSLDEDADLAPLRRRIEEQAVAHARQAMGREDLPVEVQLRLAAGHRRRVA